MNDDTFAKICTMLRHRGKRRAFVHNLKLASMLSFVAGIVNVTGVLSVKVLTTNVTGHFAYFAEGISGKHYSLAFSFLLFLFSFLAGSFVSNLLIETSGKMKWQMIYLIPMSIEIVILAVISVRYAYASISVGQGQLMACCLLLAMGMQNSLVTKASQSVVRTTHLTGLFTDLGIELSQSFFYKDKNSKRQLRKSIYLKIAIICFFFTGCVLGGFLYQFMNLYTLLIGAVCLLLALFYDTLRFRYYYLKRKILSK